MRFACLTASLFAASLHAAAPILHSDFQNGTGGWMAFGAPSASVRVTNDPLLTRIGKSALEFSYDSSAEHFAVAALPVSRSLAGAKAVRVWLRTASPSAIAIVLNERDGGRYSAVSWLEASEWHAVELTPEDFVLGTNAGDPNDPDGKLDLDQIDSIAVVDLSQIFMKSFGGGKAPLAINAHEGPQKIWIDDFEVSADAPAWYKPPAPFAIDDFSHPQPTWFTLGAASLAIDGHALRVSYQQLEDRFTLFIREIPKRDFKGATHLAFDASSEQSAHLFVTLAENEPGMKEAPRYRTQFDLSAGGTMGHHEIPLEDFERDDNGPVDPDGHLDLDKLKTLTIVDATGAFSQITRPNTIRISNVTMVKEKSGK